VNVTISGLEQPIADRDAMAALRIAAGPTSTVIRLPIVVTSMVIRTPLIGVGLQGASLPRLRQRHARPGEQSREPT